VQGTINFMKRVTGTEGTVVQRLGQCVAGGDLTDIVGGDFKSNLNIIGSITELIQGFPVVRTRLEVTPTSFTAAKG
jgi:hypothetical protein